MERQTFVIQLFRLQPGDLKLADVTITERDSSLATSRAAELLERHFFDTRRRDRTMPHHAYLLDAAGALIARIRMAPGGRSEVDKGGDAPQTAL